MRLGYLLIRIEYRVKGAPKSKKARPSRPKIKMMLPAFFRDLMHHEFLPLSCEKHAVSPSLSLSLSSLSTWILKCGLFLFLRVTPKCHLKRIESCSDGRTYHCWVSYVGRYGGVLNFCPTDTRQWTHETYCRTYDSPSAQDLQWKTPNPSRIIWVL